MAARILSDGSLSKASTATVADHLKTLRSGNTGCPGNRAALHNEACSKASCTALYHVLCMVSQSGWSTSSDMQLGAQLLSLFGASALTRVSGNSETEQQSEAQIDVPAETALSLSIFFTCQMLHHTEVSSACCDSSRSHSGASVTNLVDCLQQWLAAPDPDKQSKASKQSNSKGAVAKVWLEIQACACQDLLDWQSAATQRVLKSAANQRSAYQVVCLKH